MQNFELYVITLSDENCNYPDMIEQAYVGGADVVQFRAKELSDQNFFQIGKQLMAIARKWKRPLIINDRLDIALAIEADGLHLGQEDLPIGIARSLSLSRRKFIIGKSIHSLEQALAAEKESADYIGVGPVFATPTKPDYYPVGLELIKKIKEKVKIPFVAIGGIDENNLEQVIDAGAESIAVVRAVCGKEDIAGASRILKEKINRAKLKRNVIQQILQ